MYDPARPGDELPAAQLLDVTNEAELESFLGRLVDSAVRRAGVRVPAATRGPWSPCSGGPPSGPCRR